MNAPVRKLSMVVAALFASLLVSTTLIQYVFAAELNARPDNRRTLLSTFARERGHTLIELAFSWLAHRPQVASVIAGATRPEQVEQNVAAAGWKLSDEEMAEIDEITA